MATITTTARIVVGAMLLATLTPLALARTASAAPPERLVVGVIADTLVVSTRPGQVADARVGMLENGTLWVRSINGPIGRGQGCRQFAAHEVRCVGAGVTNVHFEGRVGNDRFIADHEAFPLRIWAEGRGGNDRFTGGAGDDLLEGGAGNDRLSAGRGADTIVAGGGADLVLGGRGSDTIDTSGDGAADHTEGGRGIDSLTYDIELDTHVDVEQLTPVA